jgi:hypothetical protein
MDCKALINRETNRSTDGKPREESAGEALSRGLAALRILSPPLNSSKITKTM